MSPGNLKQSPERVAMMRWVAGLGAVTAEALAIHLGGTVASARGRLHGAARDRLLVRERPLAGQPALYAVTRAGLRTSGLQGLDACRVSASNAHHLIVCSRVAAALELCYPDHRVLGERELRRDERECGVRLASARLGTRPDGHPLIHSPDLVLLPDAGGEELPVAVEVELTIKASARLAGICRAWARCRGVAGVLYLAPPDVTRALERAIEATRAGDRIVLAALDSLPWLEQGSVPR